MAGEVATPDGWVELEHPEIQGTYRCHPDAVPHWTDENHGWRVVGETPTPRAGAVTTGRES